jgi:PAS domain S-box-containing protein
VNPQHPNELRDRILPFRSDITERAITEQTLVRQKALLSGIARIFHEALTCQTEEELGEVCLRVAEEITESKFGFIGKIKGQHLEDIAVSNPGWDACSELDPHGQRKPPGNFELHGIYGRVLLDGKSFFTNDPTHHPDRIGLPVGHPPLESFLGAPLIHEGRTIGMIGLANRKGGYTPSERESVEALTQVIVEAFMRKRTDQALRESEKRFHRLFEDDLTGDFLCTPEGKIVLCNPAFATIFGFSSCDEVIGTSILDLYVDLGEREPMLKALKQQGKLWRHEAWRKRRDGEPVYIVENVVGHFNDRGELDEIKGYIFDDTERKRMEEELRRSRDELELRVRERTAELELRNTELQDFAFVASHDLNEPLRKIRAFGDMVTKRLVDFKDEASKDYLKRMQTAAARMQTLLNSLLSYSRVTTKAEPMKKTDLRKSIKEALSNLEILIREKNADVEIGNLPTIKADVVQMTQLFQNLIGNALKFRREEEAPHVKIRSKEVGDTYEIYVEDNGIGFDEKHLDKIFLPFRRLHGRSSEYEGVGMGLAICKKVVERHGGKITARSQVDKGSTFIVTLPANRKA